MTPSRRYGYQRGVGLSRRGDSLVAPARCGLQALGLGQQAVDLTDQLGDRRAHAGLDELDDLGDDALVAEHPAMAEAGGGVQAGLAPGFGQPLGVRERHLAVEPVVDDEESGVALADQLVELERAGRD